jgi:hypothetical protein
MEVEAWHKKRAVGKAAIDYSKSHTQNREVREKETGLRSGVWEQAVWEQAPEHVEKSDLGDQKTILLYTRISHTVILLAMAQTDFHDPDRIKLLTSLKEAIKDNVSSTIWAYLWLSDIEKLTELVDDAQRFPFLVQAALRNHEFERNIVRQCEFINFYIFS